MIKSYAAIAAWACDFVRCLEDRSWLVRKLLKIIIGKKVGHEFDGLHDALEEDGFLDC